MPSAPDIATARLTLRRPIERDRATWISLHRDPALYAHAPHAIAADEAAAGTWFDKLLRHWQEHGFGYHVVERAGEAVGFGGLRVADGEELNLAYRLAAHVHGQGLAKEAARAWVAWGLEWLPDQQIVAVVAPRNLASLATSRASGLVEAGSRLLPDDPPEFGESTVLAAPRVDVVRASGFDDATRRQVLDLWVATTDAGGAVGFVAGATRDQHAEALAAHEEGMRGGEATAVLLRSPESSALQGTPTPLNALNSGEVLGAAWWQRQSHPLMRHRSTVFRVMTHPARRGRNLGRLLMAGMHRVAREDGLEIGELGVRGGMGTEEFYAALGWAECGRMSGGLRVAPGDERDDIWMTRRFG